MVEAKCIMKIKDKQGNIQGYRLVDANGMENDINSLDLKKAIANGQIHVSNLKLTSNNRLIDTGDGVNKAKKTEDEFFNAIAKIEKNFARQVGGKSGECVERNTSHGVSYKDIITNVYGSYGVLVYIIFPDGEPSANAEFALARNNGFADAEFTSVIELHAPLYSDSNIKNMQSLCNQFTQSIKKWIQEKK
jgi:hypothetical protein